MRHPSYATLRGPVAVRRCVAVQRLFVLARVVVVAVLVGAALPGLVYAANTTAVPGDNLQTKINALNAGDRLTLGAGTYSTNNLVVSKTGTSGAWITITGPSSGAPAILYNTGSQNMFNVANAQYVKIANLEITHYVNSEDGFKFTGTNNDITVENCYIHNIGGVGINCSSIGANFQRLIVRHCTITATGKGSGATGEGMYLGKQGGNPSVLNSTIENNYVHHTGGSQGDGIEFNEGCLGNTIRDNVVHNTNYPCIFIENTSAGTANILERNVTWNSSNEAMQVNGNAIIRNNIVQGTTSLGLHVSGTGIECYNNVLYASGTNQAAYFGGNLTLIFVNNIVDGDTGNTPNGTVRNNYWKSTSYGTNNVTAAPGYSAGSMNFYPTSAAYVNAGWGSGAHQPSDDFNTTPRSGLPDVGAYEITSASNPGWAITTAIKQIIPASTNVAPVVDSGASASPNPVVNASTTSVSVTAHDPDSGPSALTYTWVKASGPGSVSFSPNGTGSASGSTATFSASGTYTLTVSVSDGGLTTASSTGSITVTLPTGPTIGTQPANKSVTAGATATFSVTASGSPTLSYQWQKNSVNIGGATGSSYTTPTTVVGDSGTQFRVQVTNGYGTVTSNQATLTVNSAINPVTVNVSSIPFSAAPGSTTLVVRTISLTNGGATAVTVTLTEGLSWLTVSPSPSVTMNPGQTLTVTVTADPTGLSGTLSGTLTLTNSPGGEVRTVAVSLDLTAAVAAGGGKKSGCAIGAADASGLAGLGGLLPWLVVGIGLVLVRRWGGVLSVEERDRCAGR